VSSTQTEAQAIRLKYLASVEVSNVDKKSADGERAVRLCNYTDVYYNANITADLAFMEATATDTQIDQFTLRPGDVVITKDSETPDDIAVPAFVREALDNVVCGYHLAVIRPHSALLHPKFLYWTLASTPLQARFASEATGVTRFGLRLDSIANTLVRVPDQGIQRRLTAFLDAETARIDALIEKKQQMIDLLDERLGADLERLLLGSEASETGSHLYPILGADRTLWRIKHLAVKIGSGKTPTGGAETYASEGVVFLRSQNVLVGCLSLADVAFIGPEVDEEMRATRVRSGDVLLNITGASLGRCSVVPEALGAANVNQHVCIIRPRAGVSGMLLHYAIRSRAVQGQIRQEQVGGNRDGMNFEQVGNLVVSLPTAFDAQARLTDELAKLEERHRRTVSTLRDQIELLLEHRQALITAAVSGELDLSRAA
jgi:type I restriction enzyme S subunit